MSWSSSTLFLTGLAREKLTATIMRSTKDNFAGSIVSRFCQLWKQWFVRVFVYHLPHISYICPVYFSAFFSPFSFSLPPFISSHSYLIYNLGRGNCTLIQFPTSWNLWNLKSNQGMTWILKSEELNCWKGKGDEPFKSVMYLNFGLSLHIGYAHKDIQQWALFRSCE